MRGMHICPSVTLLYVRVRVRHALTYYPHPLTATQRLYGLVMEGHYDRFADCCRWLALLYLACANCHYEVSKYYKFSRSMHRRLFVLLMSTRCWRGSLALTFALS